MTAPVWWTETWNPIIGCSHASPGCDHCYAERAAVVRAGNPVTAQYAHVVLDGRWRGNSLLVESALEKPMRWRKPRRVFVGSMTDLFHRSTPTAWRDRVFAVMGMAPQHTYMILTKRPERMREYIAGINLTAARKSAGLGLEAGVRLAGWVQEGMPNVWFGVSAENQEQADARIPHLLATPAARRFVSVEPMLGPVKIREYLMSGKDPGECGNCGKGHGFMRCPNYGAVALTDEEYGCENFKRINFALDWVICGGETGPGARPMHPDWARSLRDQCVDAGVPFFFKRWGEWWPGSWKGHESMCLYNDGTMVEFEQETILAEEKRSGLPHSSRSTTIVSRVGHRRAGRLLDGQEWNQVPGGEG